MSWIRAGPPSLARGARQGRRWRRRRGGPKKSARSAKSLFVLPFFFFENTLSLHCSCRSDCAASSASSPGLELERRRRRRREEEGEEGRGSREKWRGRSLRRLPASPRSPGSSDNEDHRAARSSGSSTPLQRRQRREPGRRSDGPAALAERDGGPGTGPAAPEAGAPLTTGRLALHRVGKSDYLPFPQDGGGTCPAAHSERGRRRTPGPDSERWSGHYARSKPAVAD
ncbi:unnamed protein product [Prorocentrum cordatum]|uniref:Uncharacterized protein n=1 Tax=Prorocentrum cordatum TaxID=2364126 RepID=A0ABN9QK74_9DINO|nr:unnamed protein product [Polarella glacialis]